MSISEIFAQKGEAFFRKCEKEAAAGLIADFGVCVIATGGGAFINDDTRKLLLDKTCCIWIRATLDILLERVGRNDDRPLLSGKNKEQVLANLMQQRYPIYEESHITVDTSASPHQILVDEIIKKLEERWKN